MPSRQVYTFTEEGAQKLVDAYHVTMGLERSPPRDRNRRGRHRTLRYGPRVRNDSSEDVPAFGLMVVTGATYENGEIIITVDKPSTTFYPRLLVNGPDIIAAGADGYAQATGERYIIAHDSSWTPTNGDIGGPKPGQWLLFENYPWTTIVDDVYQPGGSEDYLIGTFGPITSSIGKTSAAITGGTGDQKAKVDFYYGLPFNGSDAGYTTLQPCYSKVDIDSGLWIDLQLRNGAWLIQPLECNA